MIMHPAQPGPFYWSYRCLHCSENVSEHAGFIRLLLWRLKGKKFI
jgi:hypothetical protein